MKKEILASYLVSYTIGLAWGGSYLMLQIYAYDLGASYLEISLLSALFSLAVGFTQPIWGILSDALRKRKVFITINGFLSLPVYLLLAYPNVWAIILLRILWAILISGIPVITLVIVTSVVSKERTGSWTGGFYMLNSLGFSTGMFTQGFLYDNYGPLNTLTVYAISFFISIVIFLKIVDEKRVGIYQENNERQHISEGVLKAATKTFVSRFKSLSKGGMISIVLILVFLLVLGHSIMIGLLSIYMIESGIPNTYIGFVFSLLSLTGVFVSAPFGYIADKLGRKTVLVAGGTMLATGAMMLFFLMPTLYTFIIAISIDGAGYAAITSAGPAYLSDITSTEERGEVIGLFNSSLSIGWGVGPLLSGVIATLLGGIRPTFLAAIMICVVGIVLMIVYLKESLKMKTD
ncbi:MAG: MFS transporter [Candidatus Asgardarchaeia archaeon]